MALDSSPSRDTGPSTDVLSHSTVDDVNRSGDERGGRERIADGHETPAGQEHACPLCGFTDETRAAVYDHLLTGHRKGAISAVLLETRSEIRDQRSRSRR